MRACTVASDLARFALLVQDMDGALGQAWGELTFEEAARYLAQPDAASLEFVAVAVDAEDQRNLERVAAVVRAARAREIAVVLIASDVSPAALHSLMRLGASTFIPYPLPDDELARALARLREPPRAPAAVHAHRRGREGQVLPVHGLAGGAGSTMLAVNLAWELAGLGKGDAAPRVCLMDLDLQFGAVATALDLPRREAVYELLSDATEVDAAGFLGALQVAGDRVSVLTAPPEALPLDFLGPREVAHLISLAQDSFDHVVIDMPTALVAWTETVLEASAAYLMPTLLDLRCAQNLQRILRLLRSEGLPQDRMRFVLNRAPGRMDLQGRARLKRFCEGLDITLEARLPDGGRAVGVAADAGEPLARAARRNPLRREVERLARRLHAERTSAAAARAAG